MVRRSEPGAGERPYAREKIDQHDAHHGGAGPPQAAEIAEDGLAGEAGKHELLSGESNRDRHQDSDQHRGGDAADQLDQNQADAPGGQQDVGPYAQVAPRCRPAAWAMVGGHDQQDPDEVRGQDFQQVDRIGEQLAHRADGPARNPPTPQAIQRAVDEVVRCFVMFLDAVVFFFYQEKAAKPPD